MAQESKDTIYVDVEDEITTVIDKVASSNKKLVALVLPKRASVFQSIVNMKLLKRKSDEAKKDLVLVTAEAGLLPLAGAVGLHVAKTLTSKPEIPAAPVIAEAAGLAAEETASLDDLEPDKGAPEPPAAEAEEMKQEAQKEISKSEAKTKKPAEDAEAIELDNSDENTPTETAMPAAAIATAEAKKKAKKNKSLKVPNFEKFRLLAVLGIVGVVALIVLLILMFSVFPHATVDIKTNAKNVSTNLTFNLSTTANSLDTSTNTVPAKVVSETKTYTATVNATGQQNNGQTASGTVSMTAVECGIQLANDLPQGSEITQSGHAYITQAVTSFSSNAHNNHGCFSYNALSTTAISAQSGGSAYNTSSNNTTFTVPSRSDITATGGASGGTDDNVTVVSQADISNAENKISADSSGAKSDLTSQLNQANFYPINSTFTASTPNISPNATAGTAASSVTVTETVKYTMYGANQTDLNQLLNSSVTSQTGSNQTILNNGLSSATYSAGSSPTNLTLSTTAVVGPKINIAILKKEIAGQKVATIKSIVSSNPDVSSVTVKLSPFYVSKAPGMSKITINIAKPTNNPNAQ